jgi:hypothetical protein
MSHKKISFIKSILRMIGFFVGFFNIHAMLALLMIAEVIGVIEEESDEPSYKTS